MNNRFAYSTFLTFAIALIINWLPTESLAQNRQKVKKLEAFMEESYRAGQFSGAVLVAEKGKVIFSKGYGLANREWNLPNTPDTKFRIGSLTKQFTSMLVMQLVEKGQLRLDGHISDYLPDYPKVTGDNITLHHLLTHTSGIPSYTGLPRFVAETSIRPTTPTAFWSTFANLPLEFEPGSKFHYSNSGYFLLGAIIEKVTGKSYAQVLQENILRPLHMDNSGYDLPGTVLVKRAAGYQKTPAGFENAPYLDMTVPYAAGSLYSTVEDLYKWDRALDSDQLLSAASKALMFKPFLNNYGYAWMTARGVLGKDTLTLVEHNGGINGFGSLLTRIPQDQSLIVVLDNQGGEHLTEVDRGLLHILYNQPAAKPKPAPTVAAAPTPAPKPLGSNASPLTSYVGKYQLAPTFFIAITAENSQLFLQATGQSRFELAAETTGHYSIKEVQADIEFVKAASGAVEKLILHQGGRDLPGVKVE
ncbi:serine hydrolase [Hymenobacter sp. BT491]|nr:serine hydrolase [Hymenobacter sp. BT491]